MLARGFTLRTVLEMDANNSIPKSIQEFLAINSEALNQVEKRQDIDSIYLPFEFLLIDSIARQLSELFRRNDRPWRVELAFKTGPLPPSMDKHQVRTALSILHPVHFLSLRNFYSLDEPIPPDKTTNLVLQCLPRFDNLKCLDLDRWADMDLYQVKTLILEIPGLPSFTRFSIIPQTPIQNPVCLSAADSQLHSIHVAFEEFDSAQEPLDLVQALSTLPFLEELDVFMDIKSRSSEDMMIPRRLFDWMGTPQCMLTHLSMRLQGTVATMLIEVIPQMRLLQSLTTDFYSEALLQAVANAPSIQHLGFHCDLDRVQAHRLLMFQLEDRPRLVSIWLQPNSRIDHESRDAIAVVSHIYHELGPIWRSTQGTNPAPVSAWPWIMAKVSSNVQYVTISACDASEERNPILESIWPLLLARLGSIITNQLSDTGTLFSLDVLFAMMKRFPQVASSLTTTEVRERSHFDE